MFRTSNPLTSTSSSIRGTWISLDPVFSAVRYAWTVSSTADCALLRRWLRGVSAGPFGRSSSSSTPAPCGWQSSFGTTVVSHGACGSSHVLPFPRGVCCPKGSHVRRILCTLGAVALSMCIGRILAVRRSTGRAWLSCSLGAGSLVLVPPGRATSSARLLALALLRKPEENLHHGSAQQPGSGDRHREQGGEHSADDLNFTGEFADVGRSGLGAFVGRAGRDYCCAHLRVALIRIVHQWMQRLLSYCKL